MKCHNETKDEHTIEIRVHDRRGASTLSVCIEGFKMNE